MGYRLFEVAGAVGMKLLLRVEVCKKNISPEPVILVYRGVFLSITSEQ
jgi:hypothetical protein